MLINRIGRLPAEADDIDGEDTYLVPTGESRLGLIKVQEKRD